jgi:hypothetical protein
MLVQFRKERASKLPSPRYKRIAAQIDFPMQTNEISTSQVFHFLLGGKRGTARKFDFRVGYKRF